MAADKKSMSGANKIGGATIVRFVAHRTKFARLVYQKLMLQNYFPEKVLLVTGWLGCANIANSDNRQPAMGCNWGGIVSNASKQLVWCCECLSWLTSQCRRLTINVWHQEYSCWHKTYNRHYAMVKQINQQHSCPIKQFQSYCSGGSGGLAVPQKSGRVVQMKNVGIHLRTFSHIE